MCKSKRERGECSVDLNIKVEGKIRWVPNVIGFFTFSLNYLSIQCIVLYTFSLCYDAGINAGIVTTIWAINPLFSAVMDRVLFG